LKKNHYALPDAQNLVTGRVHAHPDGFGFLILDDKGAEDLYLNRREMRRVMHGDRAMVRVDRKKRGGVEATSCKFWSGHRNGSSGPIRTRWQRLSRFRWIRESPPPFRCAKQVRRKGKVVAAEISRYGTAMSGPEAELYRSSGSDDPEVQVQSIVSVTVLQPFSRTSPSGKSQAPHSPSAREIVARTDLRNLPTVTIDGELARDLTTLYACEKPTATMSFGLIAEALLYVRPGTAIDQRLTAGHERLFSG
jgi:ribonuclease R